MYTVINKFDGLGDLVLSPKCYQQILLWKIVKGVADDENDDKSG